MSRKAVKRVMIFFIIFLPVQYALVGLLDVVRSEPWPALVLPAFKEAAGHQKKIAVWRVHFLVKNTETGKSKEIKAGILFPNIPKSQLSGFLELHFPQSNHDVRYSEEVKSWLQSRIKQLRLSWVPRKLVVRWTKKAYQTGQARLHTEIQNHYTISLGRE